MKNFYRSIKRLFYWFPVIWKDRDWDDYFIWSLLHHKFKSMENFYRYKAQPIVGDNRASQIRICNLLLKRLTDSNYLDIAFKQHEKKWGKLITNHRDYEKDLTSVFISRTKVTPETALQERVESNYCRELEAYLEKQDLVYLSHLISKHSRGWWD